MFGTAYQRLLRINTNGSFCVDDIYRDSKKYAGNNVVPINSHLENLPILLNGIDVKFWNRSAADFFYIYGVGIDLFKHWLLRDAVRKNIPKIFIEDGFLRSIDIYTKEPGISLLVDDVGIYYDARYPSRLENLLNSERKLTDQELGRARSVMEKILRTRITKYNMAPCYVPNVGRTGKRKILVIDQAYQDYSITCGLASDKTFFDMLEAAIRENPGSDILVKTHPESARGGRNGYYDRLNDGANVYRFTDAINPICLLQYVDKVYCVTTQMGFEALICEKKVVTFGMPFYGGWGLTDSRVQCPRRIKKRTVEEVFFFAYIEYSRYMNPRTGKMCEIEEAIDYLVDRRDMIVGDK